MNITQTPIKLFDTTLRDGEQGIGFAMNAAQKTAVLQQLDPLGFDIIELGFPAASTEDAAWITSALAQPLMTKPCLFSRLNRVDLETTVSVTNGKTVQVQLLGVGSELHLYKKRGQTIKEAFLELEKSITYLQRKGIDDIAVIFEDATRGSFRLLTELTLRCIDLNVRTITIADTVGCATPTKIKALVRHLRNLIPEMIDLGIHCHNDMGLAVANTLTAINEGATLAQTTLGGIGERAGNCAIEELFAAIYFNKLTTTTRNIEPSALVVAVEKLFTLLNKPIASNKAIIGEHVFSTAAGLHQDGLLKSPEIYEHVQAATFGKTRRFIVNRLSGQKALEHILNEQCIPEEYHEQFSTFLLEQHTDFSNEDILGQWQCFLRHQEKPHVST